jgi:hypothetical protein
VSRLVATARRLEVTAAKIEPTLTAFATGASGKYELEVARSGRASKLRRPRMHNGDSARRPGFVCVHAFVGENVGRTPGQLRSVVPDEVLDPVARRELDRALHPLVTLLLGEVRGRRGAAGHGVAELGEVLLQACGCDEA